MTGCKEKFLELEYDVQGSVKFGDGSNVEIAGKALSSLRVSQENIAYSPECTTSHGFETTSSLSENLTRMDARWILRTE